MESKFLLIVDEQTSCFCMVSLGVKTIVFSSQKVFNLEKLFQGDSILVLIGFIEVTMFYVNIARSYLIFWLFIEYIMSRLCGHNSSVCQSEYIIFM